MFILKYLENSDAACTSEVELFATESEAHSKMETQYEATVRLLGGNFLSEEPADADEASRWSTIGKEYACVQDGIDSYRWEIIEDDRFIPRSEN